MSYPARAEGLGNYDKSLKWIHNDTKKVIFFFCLYIYADDIAILANTLAQAETLLHSLERTTGGIGLHVNARKTEYMCLNQTGDLSTLGGSSLKLVAKFTYIGSSVSSTEKDIDTPLAKA